MVRDGRGCWERVRGAVKSPRWRERERERVTRSEGVRRINCSPRRGR